MENILYPFTITLAFHLLVYLIVSTTLRPPVKPYYLAELHRRIGYIFNTLYLAWRGSAYFFSSIPYGSTSTPDEIFIVSVIFSFWFFDTFLITFGGLLNRPVIIHHIGVYLACISTLYIGRGAIDIICINYMSEVMNWTSFFKNILLSTNQKHTASYQIASVIYMLCFFIVRCVLGTPVVYLMVTSNALITNKIGAILLHISILMWGIPMPSIILKRYRAYRERKAKGIRLPWFVPISQDSSKKVE